MSKETTYPIGHVEAGPPPKADLPRLAELARQAYEQKRTKECLDLTRTILLIDPENAAANSMRSNIQSQMQHDLESARAFFRQARSKETAEENTAREEPEAVLREIGESLAQSVVPEPAPPTARLWVLAGALCGVLVVVFVVVVVPRLRNNSNSKPVTAASSSLVKSAAAVPVAAPAIPALSPAATPAPAPPSVPAIVESRPANVPPVSRPALKTPEAGPIAVATGTLAVSSATTVDIYEGGSYIGSAPVSLSLSAGTHTLEYRHGNMRRNVTHVVRGDETTRAMITFDVNVQINSKPWAEVFLEGVERKALGQTPLSGVPVPIGSILVFENPQFQAKRYRVTGNETGIQIVFP